MTYTLRVHLTPIEESQLCVMAHADGKTMEKLAADLITEESKRRGIVTLKNMKKGHGVTSAIGRGGRIENSFCIS